MRDTETQELIDEARSEPVTSEPSYWPPTTITLTGAELTAYLALREASAAALQAQNAHAAAGARLREAIGNLCQVVAPGEVRPGTGRGDE